MNILFLLFFVELLLLIVVLINRFCRKADVNKTLGFITFLCAIQILASLPSYINMKDYAQDHILYRIAFNSFAVTCILNDFILLLSAQYLLKIAKLRTKLSRYVFVFFWIFAAVDTVIFLTNGFTSLAYTGTLVNTGEALDSYVFFFHLSEKWMICHQSFNVILVLMIFVSMVVKCFSMPLLYSGKYIVIGFYFLAVTGLSFAGDLFPYYLVASILSSLLIGAIPFLLYYQAYFYRPWFLLGFIRQMIFDRLGTPVILFDDDNALADFNSSAEKIFNLKKSDVNKLLLSVFLRVSLGNQLRERSTSTIEEVKIKNSAGNELIFKLDYIKLKDDSLKDYGTLLFFHDITELKKIYNSLEQTAMTDPLTGLANKVSLQKKITEINLYRKFPYTAVVCSLNEINLISECFGEDTGRTATKHVAQLLKSQLRLSDFAAYDDGNMIILMSDTTEEEANQVLKRISRIVNHDRTFNFSLFFEYGIAARPSAEGTMQQTVQQAYVAMVNRKMKSDEQVHETIIDSLRDALRFSTFETEQHSLRVRKNAVLIAQKFNLKDEELEDLKNLALFHDIGKLSVPAELLNKPDSLTLEEKQIMQLHVINGYRIANAFKELRSIAKGILCHHEKWDGSGYPNGYKGDNIPFLSRIVSVADSYDVMTHDRPYQKARTESEAVYEIINKSGTQFDPSVVGAFLSLDFVQEILKK